MQKPGYDHDFGAQGRVMSLEFRAMGYDLAPFERIAFVPFPFSTTGLNEHRPSEFLASGRLYPAIQIVRRGGCGVSGRRGTG